MSWCVPIYNTTGSGCPHLQSCRARVSPFTILQGQGVPIYNTTGPGCPHLQSCRARVSPFTILQGQGVPIYNTTGPGCPTSYRIKHCINQRVEQIIYNNWIVLKSFHADPIILHFEKQCFLSIMCVFGPKWFSLKFECCRITTRSPTASFIFVF